VPAIPCLVSNVSSRKGEVMQYSFTQHIPGDCSRADISGTGRESVFSCLDIDSCMYPNLYCICRHEKIEEAPVNVRLIDERQKTTITKPEDRLTLSERYGRGGCIRGY
jgi:hypothetical protein